MEAKHELKEALIKFGTVKGRIFRLLSSVSLCFYPRVHFTHPKIPNLALDL